MRKKIALKLMKMDGNADLSDGEERVLTKEHQLARHVWESVSLYSTMLQSLDVAQNLMSKVCLLASVDVRMFLSHCKALSGIDTTTVLHEPDRISHLSMEGVCEMSRSFEWTPPPL